MNVTKLITIMLDDGTELTLTTDEAIELRNRLTNLIGDKTMVEYPPYYTPCVPHDGYKYPAPNYHPNEFWCSSGSGTNNMSNGDN